VYVILGMNQCVKKRKLAYSDFSMLSHFTEVRGVTEVIDGVHGTTASGRCRCA